MESRRGAARAWEIARDARHGKCLAID
jgi:hypothetical protein